MRLIRLGQDRHGWLENISKPWWTSRGIRSFKVRVCAGGGGRACLQPSGARYAATRVVSGCLQHRDCPRRGRCKRLQQQAPGRDDTTRMFAAAQCQPAVGKAHPQAGAISAPYTSRQSSGSLCYTGLHT